MYEEIPEGFPALFDSPAEPARPKPRSFRVRTEMVLALLLGVLVAVSAVQAVQLADLRVRLQAVTSSAAAATAAMPAAAGDGGGGTPTQRGGC